MVHSGGGDNSTMMKFGQTIGDGLVLNEEWRHVAIEFLNANGLERNGQLEWMNEWMNMRV